jgi:hypothetical protein
MILPILLTIISVFFTSTAFSQSAKSYKEISSGSYYCAHENGADEWFMYTSSSPKGVILTSVDKTDVDTYVEVYHKGQKTPFLRSDDYKDAQSKVSFIAQADSVYLIKWRGIYAEKGYHWNCIEESVKPGEHSTTAIEVTSGTMQFQLYPEKEVWYKYVCDVNSWLEINSTYNECVIYKKNVDGELIEVSSLSFHHIFSFSPLKGEEYYFKWINQSGGQRNVSWSLKSKEPQLGKTPETAEDLIIGSQIQLTSEAAIDYYYKFKPDLVG